MASESGCPLEIHHIEIEKCDEMYDKDCQANKNLSMPFYRANYDRITGQSPNTPREQVISNFVLQSHKICNIITFRLLHLKCYQLSIFLINR